MERAARLMAGLALLVAAAGCSDRPHAAGQDPDRPSIDLGERLVYGEHVWLNGTLRVSALPAATAPATSPDDPVGCVIIRDAESQSDSYLGGAFLVIDWVSASNATDRLDVELRDVNGVAQLTSGVSPLVLAFNITDDPGEEDSPMRTPLTFRLAPAQDALVFQDALARYTLVLGIIESRILALEAVQCGSELPGP